MEESGFVAGLPLLAGGGGKEGEHGCALTHPAGAVASAERGTQTARDGPEGK